MPTLVATGDNQNNDSVLITGYHSSVHGAHVSYPRVHLGYRPASGTVNADHNGGVPSPHASCEGGFDRTCQTPTPVLATTWEHNGGEG